MNTWENIKQEDPYNDDDSIDADQDEDVCNDAEGVWSPDIEQSFQEALSIYPPCGRRKIILSEEGKMYGRNELIARYIKLRTGKTRTRKQVSSHIQVLAKRKTKDYCQNVPLNGSTTTNKDNKSVHLTSAQIISPQSNILSTNKACLNYATNTNHQLNYVSQTTTTPPATTTTSTTSTLNTNVNPSIWTHPGLQNVNNSNDAKMLTAAAAAAAATASILYNSNSQSNFNSANVLATALQQQQQQQQQTQSTSNRPHHRHQSHHHHHHHHHINTPVDSSPSQTPPPTQSQSSQSSQNQTTNYNVSNTLNTNILAATSSPSSSSWNHLSKVIGLNHFRLIEFSGFLEQHRDPDIYHKHLFVHLNPELNPNDDFECIHAKEFVDKFPDDDLIIDKSLAYLVKFWVDLNYAIQDSVTAMYAVTNIFESPEPLTISCSTKVCSFGNQVVEKVETEHSSYENGRYVYRLENKPMCEYMIAFINKLKQLPEKTHKNSVLENFSVLQSIRNHETQEVLLTLAYLFEVSTSEHGAQHIIYRLIKD